MKATPLPRTFYARDPVVLARDLLGKKLIRLHRGKILGGYISETEAYRGDGDTASHASRGMTPRNRVMFGEGGHAYVYFCYGIHFMFNIVTGEAGVAGAVLIRGCVPTEGIEIMQGLRGGQKQLADGPGKLCQAFAIGRELNGADLTTGEELWLENHLEIKNKEVVKTPRIGIDYALPRDRERLWRFCLKEPAAHRA